MSTKLPHEQAMEHQLNSVPLPSEEQSWKAMKLLMEKDKKRPFAFYVRKYGIWCLLALFTFAVVIGLVNTYGTNTVKTTPQQGAKILINHVNDTIDHQQVASSNTDDSREPAMEKAPIDSTTIPLNDAAKQILAQVDTTDKSAAGRANISHKQPGNETLKPSLSNKGFAKNKTAQSAIALTNNKQNNRDHISTVPASRAVNRFNQKATKEPLLSFILKDKKMTASQNVSASFPETNANAVKGNFLNIKDQTSVETVAGKTVSLKEKSELSTTKQATPVMMNNKKMEQKSTDSIHSDSSKMVPVKAPHSLAVKDSAITVLTSAAKTTQQNNRKPSMIWSAGVTIKQQIPIGDQQLVSYGYNGTKNIVNDYIPGIYIRLEKPQKWYLLTGFIYGTPQQVPTFAYNRKTTLSNDFTQITTTSLKLRKAYYHEIPLSFNYYLMPNWSIGAGAIYGLLHRSITEQMVSTKSLATQQEIVSSRIIATPFRDSFLYKSQTHFMLQTDYHWRRFTIGARYSRDAEPYIKFTHPDGTLEEKKNWSLEFILRFRLWQSHR